MPPKHKKIRFTSSKQIETEIDKYLNKALRHLDRAEELERAELSKLKKSELSRYASEKIALIHGASEDHALSIKMRRAATRIYEKRLPILKNKLSEFNTEPMIVVTGSDTSVEGL